MSEVSTQAGPQFDVAALGLHAPAIHQWFGLWAIEPVFGQAFAQRMQGFNLAQHAQHVTQTVIVGTSDPQAAAASSDLARNRYEVRISSGVALIDVSGTVMKYASSLSDSTSTVALRQQLRAADRNPDVREVLLRIDSPGGTVAGVREVFDDLQSMSKPVTAFIEDLGASAGYWIAAGAKSIYANAGARVGSIGVFMAVADQSKSAEQLGVKVHVVATGAFKGLGVPGTEITDQHLTYLQELVDQHFEDFQAAVLSGRSKLSAKALKAVADGRVFPAAQAAEKGLIDGVKTFDEVVAELQARAAGGVRPKGKAVSAENSDSTPKAATLAATLAEIKANCPGASNDFIVGQLEKGATISQASQAWMAEQQQQIAAAQAAIKAKDEELAKAKAEQQQLGNKPVGAGLGGHDDEAADDSGGDAVAQFNAEVKKLTSKGRDLKTAVRAVAVSKPELHAAYQEQLRAGPSYADSFKKARTHKAV